MPIRAFAKPLASAVLVIATVACSSDASTADSCSITCGCPASDASGTCTGEITASLSCGSGELSCKQTKDRYGTLVSETCEYPNGKHFWCSTQLDQLGRVAHFDCGLEGEKATCTGP